MNNSRGKSIRNIIGSVLASVPFIVALSPVQACTTEAYLGSVCMTAGSYCPRGTVEAAGQLVAITANQALFAVMGTTYGGDGRTNFGMPDLRGRTPVGAGQRPGPGLTFVRQGQKRGVESVILQQSQMPSHTHSLNALPVDATGNVESGAWLANTRIPGSRGTAAAATYATDGSATVLNSGSISVSGGNSAIDNLPPQLGMRYCIVTDGAFPPRN